MQPLSVNIYEDFRYGAQAIKFGKKVLFVGNKYPSLLLLPSTLLA